MQAKTFVVLLLIACLVMQAESFLWSRRRRYYVRRRRYLRRRYYVRRRYGDNRQEEEDNADDIDDVSKYKCYCEY